VVGTHARALTFPLFGTTSVTSRCWRVLLSRAPGEAADPIYYVHGRGAVGIPHTRPTQKQKDSVSCGYKIPCDYGLCGSGPSLPVVRNAGHSKCEAKRRIVLGRPPKTAMQSPHFRGRGAGGGDCDGRFIGGLTTLLYIILAGLTGSRNHNAILTRTYLYCSWPLAASGGTSGRAPAGGCSLRSIGR
jgi:hypothetical protein